jgi:hypothetical protein
MLHTPTAAILLTIMEVAGPVLLFGGLVYATMTWQERSLGAKQAGDRKTRELYRRPDPGP